METIGQVIWVKHTFADKEITELAHKMARAEAVISEKQDALKSVTTAIKAEIAMQEMELHSSAEKLRTGYEMRSKECNVKYENDLIKFVDKETGEVLEERPMTKDEQLRLTGERVDAEQIIREDNEVNG